MKKTMLCLSLLLSGYHQAYGASASSIPIIYLQLESFDEKICRQQELFKAINTYDVTTVKKLVTQDPAIIDCQTSKHETPISCAAQRKSIRLIKELIGSSSSVSILQKDKFNKNALYYATDIDADSFKTLWNRLNDDEKKDAVNAKYDLCSKPKSLLAQEFYKFNLSTEIIREILPYATINTLLQDHLIAALVSRKNCDEFTNVICAQLEKEEFDLTVLDHSSQSLLQIAAYWNNVNAFKKILGLHSRDPKFQKYILKREYYDYTNIYHAALIGYNRQSIEIFESLLTFKYLDNLIMKGPRPLSGRFDNTPFKHAIVQAQPEILSLFLTKHKPTKDHLEIALTTIQTLNSNPTHQKASEDNLTMLLPYYSAETLNAPLQLELNDLPATRTTLFDVLLKANNIPLLAHAISYGLTISDKSLDNPVVQDSLEKIYRNSTESQKKLNLACTKIRITNWLDESIKARQTNTSDCLENYVEKQLKSNSTYATKNPHYAHDLLDSSYSLMKSINYVLQNPHPKRTVPSLQALVAEKVYTLDVGILNAQDLK